MGKWDSLKTNAGKRGKTKEERRAWWKAMTPEQQKDYIDRKVAEKNLLREQWRLDAEFKEIVK